MRIDSILGEMQLNVESSKPRRALTPDQEADLIRRYQAGDRDAGGAIVKAHDRLICAKVRRYFHKGLDHQDVRQWARVGFLKGVEKYGFEHGTKLTTYAIHWARHEAARALQEEGATIRIPMYQYEQIYFGRRRGGELSEDLQAVKRLRRTPSLDAPVRQGFDGDTFRELVADDAPGPEEAVGQQSDHRRRVDLVRRALTWLTAKQREVVERHLLVEEPESFEAIGAAMGFSKQRAEQLERTAMKKLGWVMRRLLQPGDEALWGGRRAPVSTQQTAAVAT